MKIVWVTNDVWFSKLLRFLFRETTSHVGLLFTINEKEIALDINNPKGDKYEARRKSDNQLYWLIKYNIVHQVELDLTQEQETQLYKECEAYCVGRKYDIYGYYFGLLAGLLHKVFMLPLPKKNWWTNGTGSMCQECIIPILMSSITKANGVNVDNIYLAAMTPDMTMHYMEQLTQGNPKWRWMHYGKGKKAQRC